jgi:hypothetical protein
MLGYQTASELETTKRDAYSTEAMSPQERIATFINLLETVEAIQSNFSPEERKRRKRIAEKLQPLPKPWWRRYRREALDEFRCRTSPT